VISSVAISRIPAHRRKAFPPRRERGYALLMIMFFVAVLTATAFAVVPNILTEGRRQNEEEMIWRGKQYVRGVKLYYRKLGKYPTTLDDLTKPKTGSIRFMRAEYKDPMNKEDGSWRLIYIGPAGQLIGSLKPQQNLQVPGAPGFGTPVGQPNTGVGSSILGTPSAFGSTAAPSSSSNFGSSSSFGSASSFGASSNSAFGAPIATTTSGFGNSSAATGAPDPNLPYDPATDPMLNPSPDALANLPTIIGGNIVGVGSKVNRHSIKVYEKAKNYLVFEFVYDASKEQAQALQQLNAPGTGGIGTPVGQQPGAGQTPATPPTSLPPGAGTPPTQNPPQSQNPQ
jgi:hypothetical protein